MRVFVALVAVAAAALCQDPRGSIVGTVTDSTGAILPGIEVKAVNRDTGVVAAAKASTSGAYTLPFLIPGFYIVTAEMPGFKKYVRDNIEVRVSESVEVNPVMEVGQVSETVEVVAEAVLLQTTDASQGTVVEERTIRELPLAGGNPVELALLDPGIMNETDMRERRSSMTNASSQFSAMGGGSFRNEFQIDGVSNTFAEGNARARVAFNPPSSSIGQFKIMTNPFDASVGNTIGAVVNVATKSGTNKLHGEAHYFVRNRALDTNDFFNNKRGVSRPDYSDQRYGASAGGPLNIPKLYKGRNRTFWFYAWEQNPYGYPQPFTGTVPTAAEREGDFSALLEQGGSRYQIYDPWSTVRLENGRLQREPFPNNVIPKSRFDPAGYGLANLYPLPNQPGTADGVQNYFNGGTKAAKSDVKYWVHLARFDHAFSEGHRLFLRVHRDFWEELKNQRFENGIEGIVLNRINRGIALDDVVLLSPNLVLNIRYGITQQDFTERRVSRGTDLAKLGFSPGLTKLIDSRVMTLPRVDGGAFSDYGTWEKGDGLNTSLTHNSNFTLTTQRGIHSLRFGGDFRVYRAFENRYQLESAPTLTFAATYTRGPLDTSTAAPIGQELASMLLGIATGGSMERPASFAIQNLYFGGFVQDDIKLTRRLTLNVGLRYEFETPMTERYDRLVAGFDYDTPNPISDAARAAYALNPIDELPVENFRAMGGILFAGGDGGRSPFRSEKNNFLPRIGLAYSIDDKTTLRTGYGIYYGTIGVNGTDPLQYGFSQATPIRATLDSGLTYQALVSNPFPDGLLEPVGRSLGLKTYLSQGFSFHNRNRIQPYSQRWTFGLQRLLPGGMLIDGSYVGNRGTRLDITRQINSTPRQYLSTSPVRDQPTIDFLGRNFPNPFNGLASLYTRTISRANLLRPYPHFGAISVQEPVGYNWYHSLQVRATRRMSHGLSVQVGYAFSKLMEAMTFLNETDPVPYETLSASHRPHRLTVNGVWEIPVGRRRAFFRHMPMPLQALFGSWQLSGVLMIQSGPPLTWGNILFNGDMHDVQLPASERDVDRWFNTEAGFVRDSRQQLASNIRTFPIRFAAATADGQERFDLSLTKSFQTWERSQLRFRAHCFNVLNHANFNAPNVSPTSQAFGTLTNTTGMPRTFQLSATYTF